MNNNRISSKQMTSILTVFMIGSAVVIGVTAGQDSWICIIIGATLFFPMMLVYARILTLYPGQGLFDIVITVFGKFWGKLITFVYIAYTIHLGAIVARTFTEFVKAVNMPETPQILLLAFLILISIWISRSGVENLGRMSDFLLPFLLIIILLTFILSVRNMNVSNLLPVLGTDIKKIAIGGLTAAALPFGETVLLTAIFSADKQDNPPYRTFFIALIIAALAELIMVLRNILVLGPVSAQMFYYPSYESVSVIALGDFLTRVEILIGVILLLAGTLKLSACVTCVTVGLSKLFDLDDVHVMAAPAGLLVVTLAVIVYSNSEQVFDFLNIFPVFVLPYQVILPLIILAGAEIKSRHTRPDIANPPQTNIP